MTRVVIVVPCYNEARRLPVDAFLSFRLERADVRFLFVDDGSTDATHEVLSDLVRRGGDRILMMRLERNSGKAEAVRRGLLAALDRGTDRVGYWDADLATPLHEISRFSEVLDAHPDLDLVMGARVQLLGRTIDRRAYRHAYGRVFATAVAAMLKLPVYDSQCGAKLFRVGPDLRSIFEDTFVTRWIFDVEILARLIAVYEPRGVDAAARVFELPLEEWRDIAGSKIGPADAALAARDLAKIAYRYRAPLALRRMHVRSGYAR